MLLFPVIALAQEVKPVLSDDYLALIHNDSLLAKKGFATDTTNSFKTASLRSPEYYNGRAIRKIKISNNYVVIKPADRSTLLIGCNFTSTFEYKTPNRQPAVQNQFVQGRSQNGSLVWQGPETGELFSYGPDIKTLEFDGSNYPYDINGKLVAAAGNGKQATAYTNNLFRPARLFSESLHTQWKILTGGTQLIGGSFKCQQANERTFIKTNNNATQYFAGTLQGNLQQHSITGSYTSLREHFSHSNRNGFLNRAYQNALLTPASFDNTQGTMLGSTQRSYSTSADNPFFLLNNNEHGFLQTHKTGSLAVEKKSGDLKYSVTQLVEQLQQYSDEGYQPGTAYFANGMAVNRQKRDMNYMLREEASYLINYNDYRFRSYAGLNYTYGNNLSTIQYRAAGNYRYQRSSHDVATTFLTIYSKDYLETGLWLINKIYASNTATSDQFFMPSVSAYVQLYNLLPKTRVKVSAGANNFYSELPIDRSFSQLNLLQYSTSQALQYTPVTEVSGFDGIAPIQHKEYTARIEMDYRYRLFLTASFFTRRTINDVFPVVDNGQLLFRNVADHENNGVDLTLSVNTNAKKWRITNTLSFFANRSKVTHVQNGYNFTPIAGFADVHTVIAAGEPLGAIVGSSYQRDANGRVVIGQDGFPLVNPAPAVIGNPNPHFIIKFSNSITWKRWTFNVACEWKNGGDMWNGTQAVLDYYGRSANSAQLRNTNGYVFDGVLQNGHVNDIPVRFYDVNEPVEQNRWTRYGDSGVAAEYIQKADYLVLHDVGLSYSLDRLPVVQKITLRAYVGNIMLWTPYKGADPRQLLYDQTNATGLDYFNLPSLKTFGCNLSIQF
jgi:hypothetical protein